MILSYDSYTETLEKQKQKETELQIMKQQIQMLRESQKEILECLKYPERVTQILNDEK
jgi:DNA-directed RNA polymerase specialized sigma subunit